jgi:hypothetical protein
MAAAMLTGVQVEYDVKNVSLNILFGSCTGQEL